MTSLIDRLRRVRHSYGDERPLGGYTMAMTVFGGLAGLAVAVSAVTGRRPDIRVADVVLLTGATYQGARLITKDAVTSPLRAPFTRFDGPAGTGEVNEHVTAEGATHVIGEMVSCPFSVSVWIASAMCAGLVFAPKLTRTVGASLTAVAGANFLQLGFDALKKTTGNDGGACTSIAG